MHLSLLFSNLNANPPLKACHIIETVGLNSELKWVRYAVSPSTERSIENIVKLIWSLIQVRLLGCVLSPQLYHDPLQNWIITEYQLFLQIVLYPLQHEEQYGN